MQIKELIFMIVIILPFIFFAEVNELNKAIFAGIGYIVAKVLWDVMQWKNDEKNRKDKEK